MKVTSVPSGCGAGGKTIVFGLLKRDGCVYTEIIPDVLVQHGLFERASGVQEIGDEWLRGVYYRISEKGWAETNYNTRKSEDPCLNYGENEFIKINNIKKIDSSGYAVTIQTGISDPDKIAAWAMNADVQTAFPEIKRALQGKEEVLYIQPGLRLFDSIVKFFQRNSFTLSKLDRNKIEEKLATGTFSSFHEHIAYFSLPWPPYIDNYLDRSEYSGVIFTDPPPEIKPYQAAINKPIRHYMERLVDIGVLQKTFEQNLPLYPNHNNPARADGEVYRLTPSYRARIDASNKGGGRLYLGKPTTQLLVLEIKPEYSQMNVTVYYRQRLRFESPPSWMKEPSLLRDWPELAHKLEGMVCDGIVHYNRDTGTLSTAGTYSTCATLYEENEG